MTKVTKRTNKSRPSDKSGKAGPSREIETASGTDSSRSVKTAKRTAASRSHVRGKGSVKSGASKNLRAARSSKAKESKVKTARKVRKKAGLISFIRNRKEGNPLTRGERLWLRIILASVGGLYLAFALFFQFHFLPKTQINGVKVGWDTVEKAKGKMVARTDEYELMIKGVEGTSDEVITGKNLNVQFTQFDEVSDSLKRQKGFLWPFLAWTTKKEEINLNVTYDQAALETAMDKVGILNPEKFKPVVDAYVGPDETGHYKVFPEQMGSEIRVDEAKEAIRKAVGKGLAEVTLENYRIYPEIYSDDPGLQHREEQWNEYMKSEGMTYVLWNHDEMIFTPEVIGSLLIDNGQDISLNEQAVEDLVMSWHLNYDTYDVPWAFTNHYGDVVTVEPGDYGWRMFVDDTTASVKSNLYGHVTGRFDVDYCYKGVYDYNQGLGDTYVEVNLSTQTMWVYDGGECVIETPVVTGTNNDERRTHPGCWAIKYKDQSVILGTYEVNGYESYVNYWVCFNGGEGIHDATWRADFGGDIWQTSGSHGCVNTPIWNMPIVYDHVYDDHAVVIYY